MKQLPKIGDIFLIPHGEYFCVAKILWISKRTKNAFSFIIKNHLATTKEEALAIGNSGDNVSVKIYSGIIYIFYTSIEKLKNGEWEIIENNLLTDRENDEFQYHNIGGNLYKGDEYIRVLNEEEYKTVPKMLPAGFDTIKNFISIAFQKKAAHNTGFVSGGQK